MEVEPSVRRGSDGAVPDVLGTYIATYMYSCVYISYRLQLGRLSVRPQPELCSRSASPYARTAVSRTRRDTYTSIYIHVHNVELPVLHDYEYSVERALLYCLTACCYGIRIYTGIPYLSSTGIYVLQQNNIK